MNSLTTAENQQKLSEREIELGTAGTKNSWHNIYRESAWIFVGGLPFDLTEGDVICVFSQYGEIVNINMVRDKKTGKTKGYAFICYEDQRSTILAVDNFNTTKIMQRTIRVDHVKDYRPPDQDDKNVDDVTKIVRAEGVAPRPLTPSASEDDDFLLPMPKKEKKKKKDKKVKKKEKDVKVKKEPDSDQREKGSEVEPRKADVKQEKVDSSYDKYANGRQGTDRRNENRDDDRRVCRVSPSRGRDRGDHHRRHSPNGRRRSRSREAQHSSRHEEKGLASRKRPSSREDRRRRSRSPHRHVRSRRSRSWSRERRHNSRSPSGRH